MFVGRIVGTVVATQKAAAMTGHPLFIVEPLRIDGGDGSRMTGTGRSFVVVDTVGAGEGETVLCVQGSSARYTPETKTLPVDAAIVGIVDTVSVEGRRLAFAASRSPDRAAVAASDAASEATETPEETPTDG